MDKINQKKFHVEYTTADFVVDVIKYIIKFGFCAGLYTISFRCEEGYFKIFFAVACFAFAIVFLVQMIVRYASGEHNTFTVQRKGNDVLLKIGCEYRFIRRSEINLPTEYVEDSETLRIESLRCMIIRKGLFSTVNLYICVDNEDFFTDDPDNPGSFTKETSAFISDFIKDIDIGWFAQSAKISGINNNTLSIYSPVNGFSLFSTKKPVCTEIYGVDRQTCMDFITFLFGDLNTDSLSEVSY